MTYEQWACAKLEAARERWRELGDEDDSDERDEALYELHDAESRIVSLGLGTLDELRAER